MFINLSFTLQKWRSDQSHDIWHDDLEEVGQGGFVQLGRGGEEGEAQLGDVKVRLIDQWWEFNQNLE